MKIFLSFSLIDLGAAMLAPSYSLTSRVSVIRSFLLQDIPRHPDTRLFEVREAFKRSLLLGFQAHIRAYFAIFSSPAALRATVAEPLINALNHTPVVIYLVTVSFFLHFPPSIRVEVLVRRTVM